MRSQGSLLGAGELEVSALFAGGAHLIDTWVELEVYEVTFTFKMSVLPRCV